MTTPEEEAAPIRVGLIGLSASAATGWAGSAHLPYLLSPAGRARYRIAALCNSSEAAARRAIAAYGLPAETTKAHGSPEALAALEGITQGAVMALAEDNGIEVVVGELARYDQGLDPDANSDDPESLYPSAFGHFVVSSHPAN